MTESTATLNDVSLNVGTCWVHLCNQNPYHCHRNLETKVDRYVQNLIQNPAFNEVRNKLNLWEGGRVNIIFNSDGFSVQNSGNEELYFFDIGNISSTIVQKANKAYNKCQAHQCHHHHAHETNSFKKPLNNDLIEDDDSPIIVTLNDNIDPSDKISNKPPRAQDTLDVDDLFQTTIDSTADKKPNWKTLLENSQAMVEAMKAFENIDSLANALPHAMDQLAEIDLALSDPNLSPETKVELEKARQKILGDLLDVAKGLNIGVNDLIGLLKQQQNAAKKNKSSQKNQALLAAFDQMILKAEQAAAMNAKTKPKVKIPYQMKTTMSNNLAMLNITNIGITQSEGWQRLTFSGSGFDNNWKNDLQQKILTTKDHSTEGAWTSYLEKDLAMLSQLNKEIKPLFGKLNNQNTKVKATQEIVQILQKPENRQWAVALMTADFLLNEEFKKTETYKNPNGINHQHIVKAGREVAELKENLKILFSCIQVEFEAAPQSPYKR